MGEIRDNHNPWRDALVPASYDGNEFFCETGSYESGQRIVIHEFPKKDDCYTELMGRRFYAYTVKGYCISSAREPDYRTKRDALQQRLQQTEAGMLQLPQWIQPKHVICRVFKVIEEERLGGYCTFEMQFVEASVPPFKPTPAPLEILFQQAIDLQDRTLTVMAGQP
jgi:prophage DNA circulation protein